MEFCEGLAGLERVNERVDRKVIATRAEVGRRSRFDDMDEWFGVRSLMPRSELFTPLPEPVLWSRSIGKTVFHESHNSRFFFEEVR